MCGKNKFDRVRNDWGMNECSVTENVFNKYETCVLRWFVHVERTGDERIAKQAYNGTVNKRRMKGRPKKSWLNVVQKCLENENVRSIKNGRHERKCTNSPIMNVSRKLPRFANRPLEMEKDLERRFVP
jgi:hypothetical protein